MGIVHFISEKQKQKGHPPPEVFDPDMEGIQDNLVSHPAHFTEQIQGQFAIVIYQFSDIVHLQVTGYRVFQC